MLVEALGTAILVLVIFALSDPDNAAAPEPTLVPFFVGFTVAVLISLFAPITQAGWNPARDFGPRLVAVLAGYGTIAIPGPQGGFWIYIVGPLLGGLVGGAVYERLIGPAPAAKAAARVSRRPSEERRREADHGGQSEPRARIPAASARSRIWSTSSRDLRPRDGRAVRA